MEDIQCGDIKRHMGSIYLTFDGDVPRYACTACTDCISILGKSLCNVNNRGCCWYFPKYTLLDIQRMTKSVEGLNILEHIKSQPATIINPYYIHAKGFFDKAGYDKYIRNENKENKTENESAYQFDHTIFFRACLFVKSGYGCTIPPRYRTIVCNFFICNEAMEKARFADALKPYIEERSRYAAWVEWENRSLEHLLKEKGVDLVSNYETVLKILQNEPLDTYDFPKLEPVDMVDTWHKGA